jgi:citrate synthase
MARATSDAGGGSPHRERRSATPKGAPWRTALTHVEPNRILVRGYPVDEAMGRISFAEAVYLLFTGELPTPALGKLMDAVLVSSIDHATTPPSTLATRHVASAGASIRASVGAGLLALGHYHGGDIEGCMRLLDEAVGLVRHGLSREEAAAQLVSRHRGQHRRLPGFGHRIHTSDPRAARLFQLAFELELDGEHVQMVRTIERALNATRTPEEPRIPINVDGAIAAVCSDIGLDPSFGNALFIIARTPGLVAHAWEEHRRQRPMRSIDANQAEYDGPIERRLPEQRK